MSVKRRRDEEDQTQQPIADDVHPSRRRRFEYTESDAKLASLYNDLSDDVTSIRLNAAKALIRILEDADVSSLDTCLARLIRGLCSSRKAARVGFSVALTEVLRLTQRNLTDDVDLRRPALVQRIVSLTQAEGKPNSQERRDHFHGRCFAFGSLIRSKILFKPAISLTEWESLLDLIFQLASESIWLRRECGQMLHGALTTMSEVETLDVHFISALLAKLQSNRLTRTPEGLAIWLTASSLFPEARLPKGVWHHNDPLSSKERATVAKVLRDSGASDAVEGKDQKPTSTGAPQSTPSFAWQIVLSHLSQRYKPSKKEAKVSDFEKFWLESVDNGLFASTASTERKALGLQVVSDAFATAPEGLIDRMLSPNLMRTIINQRAQQDRYLHGSAKKPLDKLIERARADPTIIIPAFKGLTSGHGATNFDQITTTRTVDELVSRADRKSLEKIISHIADLLAHPGTSEHSQAESRRRMLADMILNMVRKIELVPGRLTEGENGSRMPWPAVFNALALAAYGTASTPPASASPPMTKTSQEALQSRILSCLNHVLSARADERLEGPSLVVGMIQTIGKDKQYSPYLDADGQVLLNLERSMKMLDKLEKRIELDEEKHRPYALSFKLLFCMSILQVHNGDADAVSVLDDLEICYLAWTESQDFSSMIVEILLSFASKPSAVYRKVAEQVFGVFASQFTDDGLQSMLDILEKKESLSGQHELFDQYDEDAEEASDVSGSVDGENASDVEMLSGSADDVDEVGSSEEDDASSDDGQESSSSEADGEDDNEEVNAFERKLALALESSRLTKDDDDQSESDGSDMDDEQMMALDGKLTTIFRERSKVANKRKDNKDAKENIINFKTRVLDLLSIYVKKQHADELAPDIILPLITVIRTTRSKQIGEKGLRVLRQLFDTCKKSKKYPKTKDAEMTIELIHHIHEEVKTNASKNHADACSKSCLFLARIALTNSISYHERIAELYTTLQAEWQTDPKSHIKGDFFAAWTNWCTTMQDHTWGPALDAESDQRS